MKVMNVVFGIGVAIILYIVVLLGINVFYPAPEWNDYNCTSEMFEPFSLCTSEMSVGECKDITLEGQKGQDECNERFQDDLDVYNKNFLLITNIIGIIIVVASMFLFSMVNIAAGTAFAGLALIFFGFIIGWQSTNDIIKFILSLVIAAMIIVFAVVVNKRYNKGNKKRK